MQAHSSSDASPQRGHTANPSALPALALFASCPRGLEAVLAHELEQLGVHSPNVAGAGVAFRADAKLAMWINLKSRIASRVLMQVGSGRYRDEDGLYRLARQTPWESWFDERMTVRVDVSAQRSPLRSLNFAALRVKDALCDRFREASGTRPSVDTREPDVRIFAFLGATEATLYLDLSGESLFKRGWRATDSAKGAAPLKENLAAGLLALAGWEPTIPLHDPYCGSATLLIEAAQQALNIAPGINRQFAFERLLGFDTLLLAELRQAAHDQAAAAIAQYRRGVAGLGLSGADIDPQSIERAKHNLARAGIPDGIIKLSVADFGSPASKAPPLRKPLAVHQDAGGDGNTGTAVGQPASAGPRGLIVTNPPYGERMRALSEFETADEDIEPNRPLRPRNEHLSGRQHARGSAQPPTRGHPRVEGVTHHIAEGSDSLAHAAHAKAMQAAGQTLRRAFGGWRVCLLSPDSELPRQLGMQPRRKTPLFNGAIECRLYCFDVFARPD